MATVSALLEFLTEQDVARITGLSLATLRRWRAKRAGPAFAKLGSSVRYRREDVALWAKSCLINTSPSNRSEVEPWSD